MPNQKGFILPIVMLVGTLVTGFYLGVKTDKDIVTNLSQNPIATVANIVTSSVSIKQTPNIPSPVPSSQDSKEPQASPSSDKYNIAGTWNFFDNQGVKYNFSFPRKGGDIEGGFSGLCSGVITGIVEPPYSDKESKFRGDIAGKCNSNIVLLFKTEMKGDIEGTVDYKNGKIHLTYELDQPMSLRGPLELTFTP